MKKKILLFSLVALMAAPVLTSCKKGENDPFLSLKSRKSRLTGEWVLKSADLTSVDGGGTTTIVLANGTLTQTSSGGSSTSTYAETMKIEKDYTYETTYTYDGDVDTEKGSWGWIGKNKSAELKNKEAFGMYVESYVEGSDTDTYTGLTTESVKVIDQLKSKELIIKIDESETPSGSTTSTYVGTMTYEKK